MDSRRWRRVRDVFAAVEDLAPEERAARLADLCGADADLRAEVQSLLDAAARDALRPGGAVGEVAPDVAPDVAPRVDSAAGSRLGAYRLRESIGRGGMGQVFLAERADGQFEQLVAIKFLAPAFGDASSAEAAARFRAEREILGRLEHPHIARLLDGGVTAHGVHYLVLEYVRGAPVTEYCDRARLPVAARLHLFEAICHAVHHAHRYLVVHRDLKPSNILVDERGAPKLLDFGIAKLIEPGAGAAATRTSTRLMTPAFASPEQVLGELVTTATDVYALGLLLYELLTGARAQPVEDLSPAEMERHVCAADPPRASSAVLAGAGAAERAARRGGLSPQRLGRLLQGDLDTILGKAMQKDPRRRYASALELADDLERQRAGLPVRARPDTLTYRVGRFVRRHRLPVAAVGLAAVALIAFAAAMSAQAARTAREAEAKSRVTEFLIGLFKVSDPAEGRGRTITARELLDAGAARVEAGLRDEPETQAVLRMAIGGAYFNLGLYAEAERQLTQALETRLRQLGPEHPDTLRSRSDLANAYLRQGGLAEAEALYRETLEIQQRVLGPEHPDTLRVIGNLAAAIGTQRRHAEAEVLYRQTLEIQRRVLGAEHPLTLLAQMNLANQLKSLGRDGEAEGLYRDTLEIQRRVLGAEHPMTLLTMSNLGNMIGVQGRHAEAERLHRETLDVRRRVLGSTHPDTLVSSYNLACWAALQGKHAEALGHLRDAIEGGYPEADSMEQDPDLAALRSDPAFQTLLAAARENQQRKLPLHPTVAPR